MKQFFISLYNLLSAVNGPDGLPLVKYCRMWNDQITRSEQGEMEKFEFPAVFIEFDSTQIMQLGEGVQLFDPLIFRVHIAHWQLDAADGTFEQNLDVYDFKQKIYKIIQKFQPGLTDTTNKVGSCIRIEEIQDYTHKGIYHYIQTYRTTLVDAEMQEPVNGDETQPNTLDAEIDLYFPEGDTVNQPYVYIDTPNYHFQ